MSSVTSNREPRLQETRDQDEAIDQVVQAAESELASLHQRRQRMAPEVVIGDALALANFTEIETEITRLERIVELADSAHNEIKRREVHQRDIEREALQKSYREREREARQRPKFWEAGDPQWLARQAAKKKRHEDLTLAANPISEQPN